MGGVGSFWWGAKRAGERLGDGVPALRYDDIDEAPPSNQIESAGGLLLLQVHESRHRRRIVPLADTTGRKLGLVSPPREISNFGAIHEIFHTHLRFRAMLTCRHAAISTCRDGALDGSVRRDLQVTQTGDLGLEQAARQEEDVST